MSHAQSPSELTRPGIFDPRFPNASFLGYPEAHLDRFMAVAEIATWKPRLHTLRDVWMLPGHAGVYDDHGFRIDYCNWVVLPSDLPVPGAALRKTDAATEAASPRQVDRASFGPKAVIAEPVLFLGWYVRHYGHFLTDSMARLWAHVETPTSVRRMFSPRGDPARARIPFIASIVGALGLAEAAMEIRQPTLFRELIVPEPSLQSCYRLFSNADAAHLAVTERLEGRRFDRPVYLSRSSLGDRLRDIPGEDEVEALFAARGFEILRPEALDLTDQIGLFNSAPIIAGFLGSAFHTSLFSRRDWRGLLLPITGDEWLSTRFLLIDNLKGYEACYLRAGRLEYRGGDRPLIQPDPAALEGHLRALGV